MLDVLVVVDWLSGNRASFRLRGATVRDLTENPVNTNVCDPCFIVSRCQNSVTRSQDVSSGQPLSLKQLPSGKSISFQWRMNRPRESSKFKLFSLRTTSPPRATESVWSRHCSFEMGRSSSWRGNAKGALKISFPSPKLLPLSCFILSVIIPLFFSTGSPFACWTPYHIITEITNFIVATSVFSQQFFYTSSPSYKFMDFVALGTLHLRNFCLTTKDFSYLRGTVPRSLRDFQLACPRRTQTKVQCSTLTAPMLKAKRAARTASHVQPRSVPAGAQAAWTVGRSRNRKTIHEPVSIPRLFV
jgi:hypothetical protein